MTPRKAPRPLRFRTNEHLLFGACVCPMAATMLPQGPMLGECLPAHEHGRPSDTGLPNLFAEYSHFALPPGYLPTKLTTLLPGKVPVKRPFDSLMAVPEFRFALAEVVQGVSVAGETP